MDSHMLEEIEKHRPELEEFFTGLIKQIAPFLVVSVFFGRIAKQQGLLDQDGRRTILGELVIEHNIPIEEARALISSGALADAEE